MAKSIGSKKHSKKKIWLKIFKRGTELNVKEIGMVAGGTGITPMYQVIRAILDDPTDPTKIHLLFANRSEEDILLKEELEEAAKDPRIKVYYTIDKVIFCWELFSIK